jgi:Raf kinase inhibitor-like YbhB/YbcL family protein
MKKIYYIIIASILSFTCIKKQSNNTIYHKGDLKITSPDYGYNLTMPDTFTCKVSKQINPEFLWAGVPPGTKSWALIMDDPDAVPVAGFVWTHWVAWNIAPGTAKIYHVSNPSIGQTGTNSFGNKNYGGPCPPAGQTHHYYFRLFALTKDSFSIPTTSTAAALRTAMNGFILDSAIYIGQFQR